jgi:RNA polymerase sigma-70 factor (ECF subfamily)
MQGVSEEERVDALLQSVAHRDRAAFRELFAATAPTLYGFLLKLLRRRDLADDVLQETYLRVWQRATRYDPTKGRGLAWMTVIARRTAIDLWRSPHGRGSSMVTLEDLPEPQEDPWDLTDVATDLRRCLEELDAPQRHLILLAFFRGLTHEELAADTSLPIGTVKSHIRRGLAKLQRCLGR